MASIPPREGDGDFSPARHPAPQPSNNTLWIVLIVGAGCLLVMCLIGGILLALLLPAVQQARSAARQSQSKNNAKQIGLAAHNFHDAYGHLPPFAPDGSDDPDVTSPVSFHTSLLPYLAQGQLFGMIDKSIPWDDQANGMAYSTVVPVFIAPEHEAVPNPNGFGPAYYVPNSRIIAENGAGVAFAQVTDGTSNTVLAATVDDSAVPAWGDPQNARDPAAGFAGGPNAFGGPSGGAVVLMMDGSARFVSASMSPGVANAIATPDGGEAVPAF